MRRILMSFVPIIFLFGCSSNDATVNQAEQKSLDVASAVGAAPGFYPGRVGGVSNVYERAEFDRYFSSARANAEEVGRRVVAVRQGQLEPGCIGKDIYTCMATMAQTLAVATPYEYGSLDIELGHDSNDPLIARDKTDINGKTIFQHSLKFQAFVPGLDAGTLIPSLNALTINVTLRDDRLIRSMSIILRANPLSAATESEYDRTGIFEVISAVSMPACRGTQRVEVYKFVENSVKSKLRPTHDFSASMSDASETRGNEGTAKFCGRNFWFYSFSGNSVSAVSRLNHTGIIGGATLTVE